MASCYIGVAYLSSLSSMLVAGLVNGCVVMAATASGNNGWRRGIVGMCDVAMSSWRVLSVVAARG